jgi:hypothetical protein
MAYTYIDVTGNFINSDSSIATGSVVAVLNQSLSNSGVEVSRNPIVALLDDTGSVNLSLVATDDTATLPTGGLYTFYIQVLGQPVVQVVTPLPHLLTDLTVDISQMPVDPLHLPTPL